MPGTVPGDLPASDETTPAPETQGEYALNPLVPWRADPWCLKHTDGFYYFTGSVPAYDRIELMCAPSLRELAFCEPKTVWRKHDSGPMSYHIWAPELHFIDGKWYLYFAAGRAEDIWNIRMYVLENDSPNPLEGQWTECGKIEANWDSFSLDATTFEHNGTRYLIWAQNDPTIKNNTNLYIAEMDTPWSIRGQQVRLSQPELDWEIRGFAVNEGAAILKRNGRIFLSYSGSATDARYCMGLLWADENSDLLDPASWHKSPQPVFASSQESGQYGPGHNSFTTSQDGSADLIIYHARPYPKTVGDPLYDPNRQARVGLIHWDASGLPIFGIPAPDGPLFFK
ncbi:alpha-N-arabinofuranosidase [bacterium]|nr:MAG: alpha-N-arabinofuranosidase [bacterium]